MSACLCGCSFVFRDTERGEEYDPLDDAPVDEAVEGDEGE